MRNPIIIEEIFESDAERVKTQAEEFNPFKRRPRNSDISFASIASTKG